MKIPKHVIVAALREREKHQRADWVERTLPDEVDLTKSTGLLAMLNLRAEDLAAKEEPAGNEGPR
jgi:hypothetical protein